MKYLVKFFVVTIFVLFCTHAFAEQKIVVMNLKEVLNSSKAGKEAQEFLKKKFNTKQKEFSEQEKKLKDEESGLLGKKASMTKEDYKKESEKLRKRVLKYQTDRRNALEDIAQQRASARSELLKKLDPILNNHVKENGISLIIDKKNVIAGSVDNDITSIIIDQLNKDLPSLNLK
tara:strand:+ start:291 stop:815 length:525 start_codon:yes stop_codon:yes gene_type:complete